jgi:prophage antirepressor-like protein
MNNDSITPFLFEEALVRTVYIGAEPWFVAADICAALEIINTTQALAALDADERSMLSIGRQGQTYVVNESGVYHLIFKSRKDAAKRFRRWVTQEVLPAIRRTGSFNQSHQTYLHLIDAQIRLGVSPDLAAKMAGKLSPAAPPAPKLTELKQLEREERETSLDMLLDVMEPNQTYTIERLLELLPRKNPFRKLTDQGRASAIGKLMEHARRDGRIHRIQNPRKALYQLPSIVQFSSDS